MNCHWITTNPVFHRLVSQENSLASFGIWHRKDLSKLCHILKLRSTTVGLFHSFSQSLTCTNCWSDGYLSNTSFTGQGLSSICNLLRANICSRKLWRYLTSFFLEIEGNVFFRYFLRVSISPIWQWWLYWQGI